LGETTSGGARVINIGREERNTPRVDDFEFFICVFLKFLVIRPLQLGFLEEPLVFFHLLIVNSTNTLDDMIQTPATDR